MKLPTAPFRIQHSDSDAAPLKRACRRLATYPFSMLSCIPRSTLPYLMALVTGAVGGRFLDYVFYLQPALYGQTFGLIFQVASTLVGLLLWIGVRDYQKLNGSVRSIFIAMTVLWVLITIHARLDQAAFNYSALMTPLVLLMIALKPPTRASAWRFADFSFTLLALAAMVSQMLHLTGLRPARTSLDTRGLLPIADLDIGFRWEGFFGDPNNAGIVGATLVIYGLHRYGLLRILLTVVGASIVIFSESRTAVIALAAGLVISIVKSRSYVARQIHPAITVGILSISTAAGVWLVWIMDQSLNGRVEIWKAYTGLFTSEPLAGVGWSGINVAVENATIPWRSSDGHSIIIDSLARHGLAIGILVCLVLGLSLVATFRASARDGGTSFSLLVVWLFGALTYTVTTWQYFNVLIIPLFVALLLASASASVKTKSGLPHG